MNSSYGCGAKTNICAFASATDDRHHFSCIAIGLCAVSLNNKEGRKEGRKAFKAAATLRRIRCFVIK